MVSLKATRPDWYSTVPAEKQGIWTKGDNKMHIARECGYLNAIRIVLRDGTIFDGYNGEERNRWDAKHAIAIRIPGRKTQKWIPVKDIEIIWADKGSSLTELITTYITKSHDALSY